MRKSILVLLLLTSLSTLSQTCKFTFKNEDEKSCGDLTPTAAGTDVTIPLSNAPDLNKCYSWRAVVFTASSPYVELLTVDDLTHIPHSFTTNELVSSPETENRCMNLRSLTFKFPEKVEWIRLFADDPNGNLAALGDTYTPAQGANSSKFKTFIKKVDSIVGAPGATAIQASWSPAFNGPQKFGVYWNLQYLSNIGVKNDWLGISSFLDIDNRSAQSPDSSVNTLTYIRFLTSHDLYDSELNGFKIRPLMVSAKTGAEYSLASDVINQISSATLQFTMVTGSVAHQESPFTLTPVAGVEAGANFENRSVTPSASKIFRWVVGADASFRFSIPPLAWMLGNKPFTLSSTFRTRLPTTDEVFTTISTVPAMPNAVPPVNNSSTITFENPNRRARIYARSELSFPLSKLLSLSVTYQYGDLPPAFRFFGHTVSISAKASSPADYEH
jgi:hypothetical protein